MAKRKTKRMRFLNYLKNQYRLVIMNKDTFEEQASFTLTRMNVFALLSTMVLLLAAIVTMIIVLTPVREYIPGYGDVNMRRNIRMVQAKADSLEEVLASQNEYLKNIQNVLAGRTGEEDETNNEENNDAGVKIYTTDSLNISEVTGEDSILRHELEQDEHITLLTDDKKPRHRSSISDYYFFAPIKGLITSGFNPDEDHYGLDIVAPEDETIKATLDGVVVLSSWTIDDGYVLGIQHDNNLVSFYKHNSVLLKNLGNFVRAGDVIAIIGSSGENSSGPHLHFELWYNGMAIDPKDYIVFN